MSHKTILLILLSLLVVVVVLLFASGQIPVLSAWIFSADVHQCRDCDLPVPRVVSHWAGNSPIAYLEFDRAMDRQSVIDALTVEPAVVLDLRWNGDALRIEPREPLASGSRYQFMLARTATDADGVSLEQEYRWGYYLDDPIFDVTRPVRNGDHSTPLAIHFNHSMDTGSVEQSLSIVPSVKGDLHWAEDNTLAMLVPAQPLPSEVEYSIRF